MEKHQDNQIDVLLELQTNLENDQNFKKSIRETFESEDPIFIEVQSLDSEIAENILFKTQQFLRSELKTIKKISNTILHLAQKIHDSMNYLQDIRFGIQKFQGIHIENNKKIKFQSLKYDLNSFKKVLILHEIQLGMIIYILRFEGSPQGQKTYATIYNYFSKFVVPFKKSLNIGVLSKLMIQQHNIYAKYKEHLVQLIKQFQKKVSTAYSILKIARKIGVLHAKLVTLAETFPYAATISSQDLFSYEPDSQRWKNLQHKYISRRLYGGRKQLIQSFEFYRANVNIINSSMNIITKDHSKYKFSLANLKSWFRVIFTASKIFQVALFKKSAYQEAQIMISEANGKLAKQIWNLPDQKIVRNFIGATLPNIQYSQVYFIPRIYTDYLSSNGNSDLPNTHIQNLTEYRDYLYPVEDYHNRLMLRVNYYRKIQQIQDWENFVPRASSLTSTFSQLWRKYIFQPEVPQKLIYHIHGGGFVSMSTFIHQTYTRPWAKQLKVPIVSVEYGKAPEHPYPQGLYDCFQGYMWSIHCFKQIFHVNPKKIILVGDSAGGNLATCLTNFLIANNLLKPDGLVLIYTPFNLNLETFTPSFITTFHDMILPHTFLKTCMKDYFQDPKCKPKSDYFISPIVTPPQIIEQYPPIKMFVGSKDPFYDDNCRFLQIVNKVVEGRAHLTVFEQFPHGFLQFHTNIAPHQPSRKALAQIQKAIEDLLHDQAKSEEQ